MGWIGSCCSFPSSSYGDLFVFFIFSLPRFRLRRMAICSIVTILCVLSLQSPSAVCSGGTVVDGKDGEGRNVPPAVAFGNAEVRAAGTRTKLLADERGRAIGPGASAEDKLVAAISAANIGSTSVYVLSEDVVLTKPLPWIVVSFSIKGGTCRTGTKTRLCYIDGAKQFPIFVSYMPCTVSMANVELRNALGGAAHLKSCKVAIDGCAFVNNTADSGAALYLGLGGMMFDVRSTLFDGNKATAYGGGAVFISAREGGVFSGCVFNGNSALGKGGAIAQFSGTNPFVINGCNFTGNIARGGGGAIWITPNVPTIGDVYITGSSFIKNRAMNSMGGAVGLEGRVKGHVCACTFAGNSGSRGGAHLVLIGTTLGHETLYVNFCPRPTNGILFRPHQNYVATDNSCVACGPPAP